MSRVICGFAGIGKSTAAKNMAGVVDLESTPFNKDWARYADVAVHMANNGYIVLTSTHKELRDALKVRGNYVVAVPPASKREEYLNRYLERGNTEDFIELLGKNWTTWIEEIRLTEPTVVIDSNLQDYLEQTNATE